MTTTLGRLDPHGMIRTVEKRVAREADPRKIQMLQTLLAHMRAESAKDIDALLATVADAVHYHTWAPGGETQSPEGPAEVRAFYTKKAEEGFLDFQYDIERLLVDEDVIVTEGVMVRPRTGPLARSLRISRHRRPCRSVHAHDHLLAVRR